MLRAEFIELFIEFTVGPLMIESWIELSEFTIEGRVTLSYKNED